MYLHFYYTCRLYLVGIILLFCVFDCKATNNTFISASELQALRDLYNSTDGKYWDWKNVDVYGPKWFHTSEFPCNFPFWQGIQCECDNVNFCKINNLDLTKYRLVGTIPSSLCDLTALINLDLRNNFLFGSIPATIGNLTQIQTLKLFGNFLNGSIPEELYENKTHLTILDLHDNNITGTISDKIEKLSAIQHLNFGYNEFTGSIPETLGNLQTILELRLEWNNLTNTIPNSIYRLNQAKIFYAHSNKLSGSLGEGFGNLSEIFDVQLDNNELSGSIPHSIGQLPNLTFFYVELNHMNGSLPIGIYNLNNLKVLSLSENQFSGSLLDLFSNLTKLDQLLLEDNQFTGSIPDSIGALNNVTYLRLDFNSFTGGVPEAICDCGNLSTAYLDNNYFSKSIPVCLFEQLASMEFNSNAFTGGIPATIGDGVFNLLLGENQLEGNLPLKCGKTLQNFDIGSNQLTGSMTASFMEYGTFIEQFNVSSNQLSHTFPRELIELAHLQYFDVSNNLFSGSIPSEVSGIEYLQIFFVTNNLIDGPLNFINASLQQYIVTMDVSNNRFTGTLPYEIFTIPTLTAFAAVENCITGSISDAICKSTALTALAIDGLHTAAHCRVSLLPLFSNSYGLKYYTPGSVPDCLFNMSQIQVLHVSGNGLVASLNKNLLIGSGLSDLTLSHHQLSSYIPDSFGMHVFEKLDVSYNRLIGELPRGSTPDNMSLFYDVNRLTGPIPPNMEHVKTISILNSNHFSCRSGRHTIPDHDPQHKYYECDTNTLQYAMYAWTTLFAVAMTCLLCILFSDYVFNLKLKEKVKAMYDKVILWNSMFTDTTLFHRLNHFQLLGKFFNNLRLALTLIILYVLLIILPCNIALSETNSTYQDKYAWVVASVYLSGLAPTVTFLVIWAIFLTFMLYVLYQSTRGAIMTAQDVVKQLEDLYRSRQFLKHLGCLLLAAIGNFIIILAVNIGYVAITTRYSTTIVTVVQIIIAIFKTFWNDVVLRSMTNWTHAICTKGLTLTTEEETYWKRIYSKFNLHTMLFNVIIIPCLATAAVSPDCFYDVIIQPAAVSSTFSYVICGTFQAEASVALGECAHTKTQTTTTSYLPPYMYSYQCSSTLVTTYAVLYVYKYMLIGFGQPLFILWLVNYCKTLPKDSKWYPFLQSCLPRINREHAGKARLPKYLFRRDRFVLRIIMYLAVMLTFGVIFPPLGVVVFVAIINQSYLTQIGLGRLANNLLEPGEGNEAKIIILNEDCSKVDVLFKQTIQVVGPPAGLFYSLFIFDMYGDKYGGSAAMPIGSILFVYSFLLSYVLYNVASRNYNRARFRSSAKIELNDVHRDFGSDSGSVSNPVHYDF